MKIDLEEYVVIRWCSLHCVRYRNRACSKATHHRALPASPGAGQRNDEHGQPAVHGLSEVEQDRTDQVHTDQVSGLAQFAAAVEKY